MNICIIYKNMTVGGAELLMVRLAQKLVNDNNVTIFCAEIDPIIKNKFNGVGANIHFSKDWSCFESILEDVQDDKKTIVLTFLFSDYIKIKSAQRKNITTLFYAVHYKALAIGSEKRRITRYIAKMVCRPIIEKVSKMETFL